MDTVGRVSLGVGAVAWIGRICCCGVAPAETHWAVTLLLLSPLVIAPMVLAMFALHPAATGGADVRTSFGMYAARWLQLPTALLLLAATALPQSPNSMLCCVPWGVVTLLMAGIGVQRLAGRRVWRLSAVCVDAGLLFLPIGSVWLCLWRLGVQPLEFKEVIVMLTAIHFHFAGLVLPMLAGWSAERVCGRWGSMTCGAVIFGVPAVAAGITATQLGVTPLFESATACGLSLAGIGAAGLQATVAVRPETPRIARSLLLASSLALLATMVLSMLYGLRSVHHWEWLNIPWMRAWHGTGNAIGACLCGVAGWMCLARSGAEVDPD